jgi:hypothetical protein
MEPSDDAPQEGLKQQQPEQPQGDGIDVQQLAERVYRLMLADIRLERARGQQPRQSKR